MGKNGVNVYEREKLYEEVWNAPVIKVAESYGVSNVAIKKICKSMKIPTPPNGYWAKLKSGKKVEKIPLPAEFNLPSIKYGLDPSNKSRSSSYPPLTFLEPQQQEKIYKIASNLKIDPDQNFCDELLNYKINIEGSNSHDIDTSISFSELIKNFESYNSGSYCTISGYHNPFSILGIIRAFVILNTIISAVKELGHSINNDLTFCIRGETITYTLYEKYTLTNHIKTPEEEKEILKYQKDIRNRIQATYPHIRAYDFCFSGKLLFYSRKNAFIKDSAYGKLEDKLDRILIQLFQQSDILLRSRLEKEEKERRRKEEWHQRNLPAINFNEEIKQLTTLLQEIQDFERAEKIRNHVTRVQANDINNEKADWIEWAKAKADWYDPIIKRNDPLFGQRRHDEKPIPEEKSISWW